jgi:hypothetical protein
MTFLNVFSREKAGLLRRRMWKGAFVSESALHIFDGGKPNSVGVIAHADDHLSLPDSPRARRIFIRRGATIPEDFNGPAALPLFCLAPHGVFRASRIASRAVSSYLAFSPLPALCCQRTGGVFSVTLSVTAVFQPRCPRVLRGMPPYGVRTFLQRTGSGSPAIICHRQIIYHRQPGRKENHRSRG